MSADLSSGTLELYRMFGVNPRKEGGAILDTDEELTLEQMIEFLMSGEVSKTKIIGPLPEDKPPAKDDNC